MVAVQGSGLERYWRTLKAGVVYFFLVFAAGFVLGTVRVLWVVPRLGGRTAELIETPIMVLVSMVAARWMVRRSSPPLTLAARLGVGWIALGFLLVAEFSVVLGLRILTLHEYFAGRDPIAGVAYILSLGLFATMPALVSRN